MSDSSNELSSGARTTNGFVVTGLWKRLRAALSPSRDLPVHLQRGEEGEALAASYLTERGLKLLKRNFRAKRGEVDLVLRDGDCLVFCEVKTRSDERWTRPAAAVNQKKRRNLTLAALEYLRRLGNPEVKVRFDIVEVLLHDVGGAEVRHLPNSFEMEAPYRYG